MHLEVVTNVNAIVTAISPHLKSPRITPTASCKYKYNANTQTPTMHHRKFLSAMMDFIIALREAGSKSFIMTSASPRDPFKRTSLFVGSSFVVLRFLNIVFP